jgi:hypothetical protein
LWLEWWLKSFWSWGGCLLGVDVSFLKVTYRCHGGLLGKSQSDGILRFLLSLWKFQVLQSITLQLEQRGFEEAFQWRIVLW